MKLNQLRRVLKATSAIISVAIIGTVGQQTAWAQTTTPSLSQTPPGEEIKRNISTTDLNLSIGGVVTAPENSEKVVFRLKSIKLDGAENAPPVDMQVLLPAPDTDMNLAEVYSLATRLQQAYNSAGYPLVRVFVPVQDMNTNAAHISLKVVSGYVGRVDVEGVDSRVRRVVARLLKPLTGQQSVRAKDLERALLLAGDIAGVSLATSLTAGKETGETILVVRGTYQPVQAVLSVDNRLSKDMGREQITLSTAFNSLLGQGERIGVTVATALDNPSVSNKALRRYFGVFADAPIGNDGLVVGVDAAYSSSRPKGALAALKLANDYRHAGVSVAYPLIRTRKERLIIRGAFDANRETQKSYLLDFAVPLYRDEIRALRLGASGYSQLYHGASVSGEIEYSHGFDILGARRRSEATIAEPLSRIGADAVFNKVTAAVDFDLPIPETAIVARFNMRTQYSFTEALLRSEQMSVVGSNLMSGPPTGSLAGDTAIAARYQFDVVDFKGQSLIVPYSFVAAGWTKLYRPSAFEEDSSYIRGLGLGTRVQIPIDERLQLALTGEYSHTFSNIPSLHGGWFTFQASIRY